MQSHNKPAFARNTLQRAASVRNWIACIICCIFTTGIAACKDARTPSAPQDNLVQLTVVAEPGVSTNLPTGVSTHPKGSTLHYEFTADSGYTNTLTAANDSHIDNKGSISLNDDITLVASADHIVSIKSEDEPLQQQLRAILTSSNQVSAVQSFLASLDTLVDSPNLDARLQRIIQATIDPINDSTQLKQLSNALSGRTFHAFTGVGSVAPKNGGNNGGNPGGPPNQPPVTVGNRIPPTRPQSSPHPTRTGNPTFPQFNNEPVTIAYVNGIFTDPITALRNTAYIAQVLNTMAWPAMIPFTVKLLYNPSSLTTTPDRRESLHRCLAALSDRAQSLGVNSYPIFFAKCASRSIKDAIARFDDLREAAWQYFKLTTNIKSPEPYARAIADSTTQWRNEGNNVLFIPHSQGNLMVQEAVNALSSSGTYNPSQDSTCISAVSLAAPLSDHWPISSKHLIGLASEGDIILSLKTNNFPRTKSALYDSATRDIDKWNKLDPLIAAYKRVTWGIRLHSIIDGYLDSTALRSNFTKSVAHAYGSCALDRISTSPLALYLKPNQTASFSPILWDMNGNPLDGKRLITWHYEPGTPMFTAASIAQNGSTFGNFVGSTPIKASSRFRSTSAVAIVEPVQLTITAKESAFTEFISDASNHIVDRSEWSPTDRCNNQRYIMFDTTTYLFGQQCQLQYEVSTQFIPNAKTYEFVLFDFNSTSSPFISIRSSPSALINRFGRAAILFLGTGEAPKRTDRIHVFARDVSDNLLASGVLCLRGCVGWPQ